MNWILACCQFSHSTSALATGLVCACDSFGLEKLIAMGEAAEAAGDLQEAAIFYRCGTATSYVVSAPMISSVFERAQQVHNERAAEVLLRAADAFQRIPGPSNSRNNLFEAIIRSKLGTLLGFGNSDLAASIVRQRELAALEIETPEMPEDVLLVGYSLKMTTWEDCAILLAVSAGSHLNGYDSSHGVCLSVRWALWRTLL